MYVPLVPTTQDRTRRAELQRLLGDRGTIQPYVARPSPARPAAGWYARLPDGRELFLGQGAILAGLAIIRMGDA